MAKRLLPASLRAQLALAIALITALALGLTFLAVYRGTGSRLQDRIDQDLATQASEWEQMRAGRRPLDAGRGRAARRAASSPRSAITRPRGSSSSTSPAGRR